MIIASLASPYGVVLLSLRARPELPDRTTVGLVVAIAVVGGMRFGVGSPAPLAGPGLGT